MASTVIPYKILSKTASTVTLSANATSSQTGITIQAVAGVELDTNANATVASPGITVTTPDPLFERFGRAFDKDVSVSYAQTGGTNLLSVENTGTGSGDHAQVIAKTTGDGGGNPILTAQVPAVASISLGIDNARTNNPAVLSRAGVPTSAILGEFYDLASGGVQWKARVQGNEASNVASANDTTWGTGGNYAHITGNTQMNGLAQANWQSGAVIYMKFDSNPLMKHNGSPSAGFGKFLFAGSVDYTPAAGSILALLFDGTNWNEISRMTR